MDILSVPNESKARSRDAFSFQLQHLPARHFFRVCLCICFVVAPLLSVDGNSFANNQPNKPIRIDPSYNERWEQVRIALFPDQEFLDGSDVIELTSPIIPDDPAAVPVAIKALIPQTEELHIKRITVLVDHNPAPLAAVFHLTPASGVADLKTRVRVGEFSWIRAVAETSDGKHYLAKAFVKASGGCDVSPRLDHEKVEQGLGEMKLRLPGGSKPGQINLAHLQIEHPNYNGMQVGNVAGVYIPVRMIQKIEVSYDEQPLLVIDGHMSLSADPQFRFHYVPDAAGEFEIRMLDSDKAVFKNQWSVQFD